MGAKQFHVIENLPMDLYVRDPAPRLFEGCKASLNASIASRILKASPLHAWTDHPKLNPDWQPDEKRDFDFGKVAHKVLLEAKSFPDLPEKFGIRLLAFSDYRKKEAQECREAAIQNGELPVLTEQWNRIHDMVIAARTYIHCTEDLAYIFESGIAEQTIVWQEGGRLNRPVHLRCRPDWVTMDRRVVLDYKSTDGSADPEYWSKWVLGETGADIQCAMNCRAIQIISGELPTFVFLVQETSAPFACSAVGLGPEEMALAGDRLETALAIWDKCLTSDNWPGYPNRISWIQRPTYVESDWAARKDRFYQQLFGEKL